MATKDWKKKKSRFSNMVANWENKEGGVVQVIEETDGMFKGQFTVFINDNRLDDNNKSFKTKSQALSFAKNYMRKN